MIESLASTKLEHAPLGAQLLGARSIGGQQLLYRSPYDAEQGKPVRGGMPVLFPQFANLGPLTKHGFARNRPWQLMDERLGKDASSITYLLDINADKDSNWSYQARLQLQVDLRRHDMAMRLTVENTGNQSFS